MKHSSFLSIVLLIALADQATHLALELLQILRLEASMPAQFVPYGSPQYGYNAQNQLVLFDMNASGNNHQGGMLDFATVDQGSSAVFLIEGLSAASIPQPYGVTQLVDTVLATSLATLDSGGTWNFSRVLPNVPEVVGISLFVQFAHVYQDGHFAGTNAWQVTVQ